MRMRRQRDRVWLSLETLERRDVPTATVCVSGSCGGAEGDHSGWFRLWRDDTNGALTVKYDLTTTPLATNNSMTMPGMVSFADGEQFAEVTVQALGWSPNQGTREVALQLTSGVDPYVIAEPDSSAIMIAG